jgi:hypothetical protein
MADQIGRPSAQPIDKGTADDHDLPDALEYPQIPLEASFDSLLRNSYPSAHNSTTPTPTSAMTRTTRPTRQPALSESWASMSDAESSQNDELLSEQTDTESLVDVRRAEDVLSIHDEASSARDEADDSSSDEDEQDEVIFAEMAGSPLKKEEPQTTEKEADEADLIPGHITLDEPRAAEESDNVHIRHTLRLFDSDESTSMPTLHEKTDLAGAIDLTLDRHYLKDNGRQSLRLLLLGQEYLPGIRDLIQSKVADALVASGRSLSSSQQSSVSRFHVIPGSFGPGSVPSTADLIPLEQHLDVQSYHSIEMSSTGGFVLFEESPDHTLVSRPTPSSLPYDLAVIITDTSETSKADMSLQLFSRLAARHSIPSFVITVDDAWKNLEGFAPIPGMVHRIITTRPVWQGDVLARLPLDLDTFLNLNSAQLSRHLSWLVRTAKSDTVIESEKTKTAWAHVWEQRIKWARTHVLRVMTCLATLFAFMLVVQVMLPTYPHGDLAPSALNATLPFSATDIAGGILESAVSASTSLSSKVSSVPVAVATTSATPPEQVYTIESAKSTTGRFELEVVGSSHFVVRTPHKAKGKAPFKIVVSREGELIETEVKSLFPCVYSIHIAQEQMYGKVAVYLEMPNPRLTDSITLDLGPESFNHWIGRVAGDVEKTVEDKLEAAHGALLDLVQLGATRKFVDQTLQAVADTVREVEQATGFDERVRQPLRNLDHERVALNERIDVMGGELAAQLSQWVVEQERNVNQLTGKALRKLQKNTMFLKQKATQLKRASRVQRELAMRDISKWLKKQKRSDTLATAQGRVQHLMSQWQRKRNEKRAERVEKKAGGRSRKCEKRGKQCKGKCQR